VAVLTYVLKDFPGERALTEGIRSYLGPYVRDWEPWWKRAQPLIKDAEYIDSSNAKKREYRLRKHTVSNAEEAYERYERLSRGADLATRYELAVPVLTASLEGRSISNEHLETVKRVIELARGDPALSAEVRLDALYRCIEARWLTVEDAKATIRERAHDGL
jgi:transcription elongation factor GreA-like protein